MSEISLLLATRSPHQKLEDLFTNVSDTAKNPKDIEILVKIDRNDANLLRYFDSGKYREFPCRVDFIITDQNGGYFNLGPAYNQLMLAADPSSYFVCVANDDIRFAAKGWDEQMLSYKHHWDDDIFYIRTSLHKEHSYNGDVFFMLTKPDNFAFYTRRLMHMMEGCGDYWSTDTWFGPILGLLEDKYMRPRRIVWPGDLFVPSSIMWSDKPQPDQMKIWTAFHRMNSHEYIKYSFERIAKKIADTIDAERIKKEANR